MIRETVIHFVGVVLTLQAMFINKVPMDIYDVVVFYQVGFVDRGFV